MKRLTFSYTARIVPKLRWGHDETREPWQKTDREKAYMASQRDLRDALLAAGLRVGMVTGVYRVRVAIHGPSVQSGPRVGWPEYVGDADNIAGAVTDAGQWTGSRATKAKIKKLKLPTPIGLFPDDRQCVAPFGWYDSVEASLRYAIEVAWELSGPEDARPGGWQE